MNNMPQGSGVIIKHLVAPDSGALDKVYGIDWNRLDDVLRGAHAQKIQHLGMLRIADDTIVINASRNLVGLNAVAQDFDPDAGGTRDLGDTTNYWDDGYIQDVYTARVHFGESDFSPIDVQLSRGAANRLDLASGDSFNIVNGSLMFGGTVIINASRIMSNIISFNQSIIPQGGGAHDLGDVANYWDDAFIDTIHTDNVVERTLGAGVTIDGVLLQDTEVIADRIWFDKSSQDVSIYRGDADLLKTDDDFSCRALYIQDCLCIASGCVAQNLGFPTKTGAFSDSDFTCPKDGLIGIDETLGTERLYFRAHGSWFYINKSG